MKHLKGYSKLGNYQIRRTGIRGKQITVPANLKQIKPGDGYTVYANAAGDLFYRKNRSKNK